MLVQDKADYQCEFILTRKSGKNVYLSKGNQVISSNDRLNPFIKTQLVRYLRNLSWEQEKDKLTKSYPMFSEMHPCQVIITVCPPSRRRIDPPNLYPTVKALIDGLTDAGLWSDDNGHIIKAMTFKLGNVTRDKKYHLTFDIYADS